MRELREVEGRVFDQFRAEFVANGEYRRVDYEAEPGAAERVARALANGAEVLRVAPRPQLGFR